MIEQPNIPLSGARWAPIAKEGLPFKLAPNMPDYS